MPTDALPPIVRSLRPLNGPNIWSARPVLEMEVNASGFDFDDWNAADELLRAGKIEGTRVATEPSAFPTNRAAHWLGEAVLKVQCEGRSPVDYHEVSATAAKVRLVVEYEEEGVGRAALEFVLRWLTALVKGESLDLPREWETFTDLAYDVRMGNSTRPTVMAAVARGIPFYRLDTESLVQLGQGCRQKRIQRATTANTGFIANGIACDKTFTKKLIEEMGILVPQGRTVSDAEDAVAAAREVGLPVVVKPQDGDYGNGVTMRITTEAEVRTAYEDARKWSEGVLVEHHVTGHLFRLLVIGGRLIAAVRREPWFVVGDGKSTLLQLIEQANFDPRRGGEYESPFLQVQRETGEMPELTDDRQAHDRVPGAGETVRLKHDIYLRNGGIHFDLTDLVHPDVERMAIEAAAAVGLDIAGLDVIANDLAQSPHGQDFVVLEVNAEPAVILHMDPICQPPRPVGEAIVDSLFATPEDSRIPLFVVLNDFDMARSLAQTQHSLHRRYHVGLASRTGVWLNDQPLGTPCDTLTQNARRLWRHPRTEAVVLHLTFDDVLAEGLPFDRCDKLIGDPVEVTNDVHRRALACLRATVVTDAK